MFEDVATQQTCILALTLSLFFVALLIADWAKHHKK
jgi:hypothetical protein